MGKLRVRLYKICLNEHGNKICKFQGTEKCNHCAVNSGQSFHNIGSRRVLFKGIDIPESVRKLWNQ